MLCNESNLSLEASGNETWKINENFSQSIQGKSVEILSHIVECIVQVMWELLPSRTAVQHFVHIRAGLQASICYACSGTLTTPAVTWQEIRPIYLE